MLTGEFPASTTLLDAQSVAGSEMPSEASGRARRIPGRRDNRGELIDGSAPRESARPLFRSPIYRGQRAPDEQLRLGPAIGPPQFGCGGNYAATILVVSSVSSVGDR